MEKYFWYTKPFRLKMPLFNLCVRSIESDVVVREWDYSQLVPWTPYIIIRVVQQHNNLSIEKTQKSR